MSCDLLAGYLHGDKKKRRNRAMGKRGNSYTKGLGTLRGKRLKTGMDGCCGVVYRMVWLIRSYVRVIIDAREQIHALSVLRLALGNFWRWVLFSFFLSLSIRVRWNAVVTD